MISYVLAFLLFSPFTKEQKKEVCIYEKSLNYVLNDLKQTSKLDSLPEPFYNFRSFNISIENELLVSQLPYVIKNKSSCFEKYSDSDKYFRYTKTHTEEVLNRWNSFLKNHKIEKRANLKAVFAQYENHVVLIQIFDYSESYIDNLLDHIVFQFEYNSKGELVCFHKFTAKH
jgi:hypothetical protein